MPARGLPVRKNQERHVKTISKQAVQQNLFRIIEFLKFDIWRMRLDEFPFGKSFLIRQLRIVILTLRGFDEDKCRLRASALTFYTLLSIVPVLAMLFGVAKGFGFEKILERELYENFPGQEEILNQIVGFSRSMLEATQGGVIAGVGLILLFWSVIKVLGNIENSLNSIWEIKEGRSWGRKFSDYLAIMLISPLIILVAGSLTVFISSELAQITSEIKYLSFFRPFVSDSLRLAPYILIWFLFSMIYILMPNTKVSFKAGILGGIVAGTIYQIVQWVYISFQIGVSRYNAIYGSFAALPLFLMWVQISWLVVLFGAEISFASQNVDTYEYEPDCLKVSPGFKRLLSLQVAHLLVKNFENGLKPLTDREISRRLQIPIRLMHQILYELVGSGLVSETRTKEDKGFGHQPALDINQLSVQSVLEALDRNGTDTIPVAATEAISVLSDSLRKFRETVSASPANKLLKDI